MSDRISLDGRDEPSRGSDDHAELLSVLDSHDLSLALETETARDRDVFTVDPDANPD